MGRDEKDCSDGGTSANKLRASHPSWKMIMSSAQTALTVAVVCSSTVRRAPSPRFLSQRLHVAHPAIPVYRLPKNRCTADLGDRHAGHGAIISGTRRHFARLSNTPQPAVSGGIRLSISIACAFSSGRTTTSHPVPKWCFAGPAGLEPRASCLIPGELPPFFYPGNSGGARDAESARQPAQTAALFVSPQNQVLLRLRVALRLWVRTAMTTTVAAVKALLAVAGAAIADKCRTTAITAFKNLSNHLSSLTPLLILNHYHKFY